MRFLRQPFYDEITSMTVIAVETQIFQNPDNPLRNMVMDLTYTMSRLTWLIDSIFKSTQNHSFITKNTVHNSEVHNVYKYLMVNMIC